MNNKEVWRDIIEYEGKYQVSNLGRVKSLARKIRTKKGFYMTIKERFLKQCFDKDGYYLVGLSKNSRIYTITVHKLVAMAFLNHKPCGYKLVVDHINNDKLDNRVENLQITTVRHNTSKDRNSYNSKYIGVQRSSNHKRWVSMIRINGKQTYLGVFNTEYEASLAYQKALKEINQSPR